MRLARSILVCLALGISAVSGANATPLLLVDMDTAQVLYEQEAGQPWHPASLTKLMTAFVAFEAIANGRVTLETPVVISKNAVNQAPSKSGLPVDSALTMKDALYVLLVKSANDVAVAIAETVSGSQGQFVTEMNGAAARMGLTATHFTNANGLHDAAQVTSARDIAILSLYIRQTFPQYMPIFETETVQLGKASLESNNDLLTHFAGTTGMKTGFVCASGLNIVATVERNGRRLMGVVLGASSGRERGEMAAELFLRGFSGAVASTGKSVLNVANSSVAPVDMRSRICGKESEAYVAARQEAFPMGLKGQLSYLTDEIHGQTYVATDLGRVRDVPLPRPRPAGFAAPVTAGFDAAMVPSVETVGAPVASRYSNADSIGTAPVPIPRTRP